MPRDHGFYWIKHPDHPQHKIIAKWCHLNGEPVWLLPGDEDYRYDEDVTVISMRQSEPGSSILSRFRDWFGLRDARRNIAYH